MWPQGRTTQTLHQVAVQSLPLNLLHRQASAEYLIVELGSSRMNMAKGGAGTSHNRAHETIPIFFQQRTTSQSHFSSPFI